MALGRISNAPAHSTSPREGTQQSTTSQNTSIIKSKSVDLQPNPASSASQIDPSLITTDYHSLQFAAAASLQIQAFWQDPDSSFAKPSVATSTHLISSPYNNALHHLDLRTLSPTESLLARALTVLKPTRPDYATADYLSSFTWDEVLNALRGLSALENHHWRESGWYTVIFRSKLKKDCDRDRLHQLDERSHAEATVSGGLLKYWFGTIDEQWRNLATCIWRTREDARTGGTGPWHKEARAAARELYEYIDFSTWRLVISDGAMSLRLEPWDEKTKE